MRNLVLIVTAFFVAIAAFAGGALILLREGGGGIDRSTPQAATDQFLEAALSLKDVNRLSLFVCSQWSAARAMEAADLPTDPRLTPFWGDMDVTSAGESATVTVRVIYRLYDDGEIQQQVQMWSLRLEQQDGWRVCGLTKDPLLDP